MPETKDVSITPRDILEFLLHGEIYDETNDTGLPVALRAQPDKTLRTYGLQVYTDANNRERIGLIDSERVIWGREFKGYLQVDGVELGAAEAELWAPGTLAAQLYEVFYHATNIDLATPVVPLTIGHGVAAAAVIGAGFWARAEPLPLGCNTGWRGPWVIGGNDSVRGNAAAAADIAVSFRVRQVDIGA